MRRRIVSLTVLSSLLCMGLFAIPLAVAAPYYFLAHEHADVERIAYAVSSAASDNLSSGSQLAAIEHSVGNIRVALYDVNAHPVSGIDYKGARDLVRQALIRKQANGNFAGRFGVAVPVIDNDRVTGVVLATVGNGNVRWLIGLTWVAMAALAGVATAATWFFARHQGKRLARPLERLSAAAERLGDGDFAGRADSAGIPEIDSVNTSLERTSARLRILLERERALSSDASHQLRTPLTGLRLALERVVDAPGDQRDAIRAALDTIGRLDSTVTDMLQLVRGTPRSQEPLDIDDLLRHVESRWEGGFGPTGRRLRVRADAPLPVAHIPASAARQILNVLIDNAGTHGIGGVTLTVRDSLGSLSIEVAQEGPPLTVPVQSMFIQRSGSGNGIGLPLARSIAQSAGARLILSSADPPTFSLLIPPAYRPEAPEPAESPDRPKDLV